MSLVFSVSEAGSGKQAEGVAGGLTSPSVRSCSSVHCIDYKQH